MKSGVRDVKLNRIRQAVIGAGFINLPLQFDANSESLYERKYNVDIKGNDTLVFDRDIYSIVGFFPDTNNYFSFLFYTVGDMLYPTIMTINKQGDKVSRQIINATGCSGHSIIDVTSCYDSVWVGRELGIKSLSRVVGTLETDDSIPKLLNICNIIKVEGYVKRNGKIILKTSEIIDCNE
jgi:hypothetical protein